ncbi:PIN2 TERF1-interacting telomerase inhibitor 1, partial [Brachionus plicatilis]
DVQCLTEADDYLKSKTVNFTKNSRLGNFWELDEQCKAIFGMNASFCKDFGNDLCLNLYCRVNKSAEYCSSHGGALQGSICDSGKICVHSECVPDKKAINDDCPFGDDAIVKDYFTNEIVMTVFIINGLKISVAVLVKYIDFCKLIDNIQLGCPKTCGICSTKITCQSDENLCKNEGVCINITTENIKSFKCECTEGYSGEYCEETEPKKKVKYSIDPNALHWANNEDKFGKRLMEKMGWQKGKGLGANENGMTDHIKVKFKLDTKGIGFKNEYDNVWLDHQDEFENLLSNLSQNSANGNDKTEKTEQVKSLEERSRQSRKLHYQKFAKSKDLSSVTANDLNCILGTQKRKLKSSKESNKIPSSETEDADVFRPSFSQVISDKVKNESENKVEDDFGLKFSTNKLSVSDYFANKMASKLNLNKNTTNGSWNDSNEERKAMTVNQVEEENFAKKKKKKRNKSKDESKTELEDEEMENLGRNGKNVNESIEIPVSFDLKETEEHDSDAKKKKKKKKNKELVESEGFCLSVKSEQTITDLDENSDNKKNELTDNNFSDTRLNEATVNENIPKKKKKKSKEKEENVSLNEESDQKTNDLDSLVKASFKGSNLLSIYGYSAYYINSNLEEVINEKVKRLNRKRYLMNKKIEIDAEYYKLSKKMNV